MKTSTMHVLSFGAFLFVIGCAGSAEERSNRGYSDESAKMDSVMMATPSNYASSSAAVEKNKDSTRKFIRTADLKFKVKDVIRTTYKIEDITARFDGFVTYTKLNSDISSKMTIPISADSSLETTFFVVENTMTLRVPNTQLDTTLKTIAKLIDFLDYRIIKADDVGLQVLANSLTQQRVNRHSARLTDAIDNRGKKLHETTNAEENLLDKQEQSDNAKIANLELKDQINYSTIQLFIYQRTDIKREVVCNYKNIDAYEPGFGAKLKESLKFGWEILEALVLFVSKLWTLILIAFIIFFVVKKYLDRPKKKE